MYWLAALVYLLIICPVIARFFFDRELYAQAIMFSIYVHGVVGLMIIVSCVFYVPIYYFVDSIK